MSAGHSPRIEELLPAYALGALDGDDLRELTAHLDRGCAECRRQLDLWERDLEALAASVLPVAPSSVTRQRVLRVAGGAVRRPSVVPRWFLLPAAALLLLAVWGVAGQARLRGEVRRLTAERDRLAQQIGSLESDVERARSDARRMTEALRVIAAPEVRTVSLAGLGPTPSAAGHTYVNPRERSALFYAFDLPALAPDKTYQLWLIADGKPVSAGTFAVDAQGAGSLRVDGIPGVESIQAWAVTVEPRGGVPQPTGEMVLKG
jgi:anti-sigma-K factor RskA/outer membrane murein-binding lipoprotein Lpp